MKRVNLSSTGSPGCSEAVIYARVSTKEQEEGFSIDAQLSLLRDYAAKRRLSVIKEFVEAESARATGRSQFKQLVALVETHNVRAIIVEKTDRLYRNLKDRVTIDELGCELHFVKEGVVLSRESRSHEKLVHDIKLVIAKNYCDNLSEEARKGMLEKAKQGIYPSTAPIGYLNVREGNRSVIAVDPERAQIVAHLFVQYAMGGISLKGAARVAREMGLRTRKGNTIPACSIAVMLQNPIYYGVIRWNGKTFPGVHEPIITKELFDQVQTAMHSRSGGNAGYGTKEFAYKGIFHCGHCLCQITSEIKKGRYIYYHCTGQRGRCPGQRSVREEELTNQLSEMLDGLVIEPEVLDWLKTALRESLDEEQTFQREQLRRLEAEEKKLRRKLEQLYIDKVNGVVPESAYPTLKSRWDDELATIEVSIRSHKVAERSYFDDGVNMLELASNAHLRFKQATPEDRRALLRHLGSNFLLVDGRVHIQLRKPFDLLLKASQNERENGENGIWWAQLDSN